MANQDDRAGGKHVREDGAAGAMGTANAASASADASARSQRMRLFLRASLFDFILVLIVSVGLVFTISYGFNSAADLRGNVVLEAVLSAVLLAILYAGSYSKRALIIAAVAYAFASAVCVGVFAALSPGAPALFVDGQLNDVENGYAIFAMVQVVVPLVTYLLSRRTWSMVVLLLAGTLACGFIQFLYRDWMTAEPGTIAALIVYAGIGALFVVQGYRQGVLGSARAKRPSFGSAFLLGVAASVVCVGVGIAAFFGIISGLGIETLNVKPFEDYFQRPIVEYEGTYQHNQVEDPDETTDDTNDEWDDTNDDADDAGNDDREGGGFSIATTVINTLNPDNWNAIFSAIRFDVEPSLVFLTFLLIFLAILAAVLARRHWRVRRLHKLQERPAAERVLLLYDYFMTCFKRLRIDKAPTLTPLEFALASANELAPFARNVSRTDFLAITLLYQRAGYGQRDITDEEYQRVVDFYNGFFPTACKLSGRLKWAFWRFWRI